MIKQILKHFNNPKELEVHVPNTDQYALISKGKVTYYTKEELKRKRKTEYQRRFREMQKNYDKLEM